MSLTPEQRQKLAIAFPELADKLETQTNIEELLKIVEQVEAQKGDKGDQGEKGDIGDTGEKGEPGEQGPQGIQGLQGVRGEKGVTGKNGKDGIDGSPDEPLTIADKLNTLEEAVNFSVIKGHKDLLTPFETRLGSLEKSNTLKPTGPIDQRWHGGGISKVSTDSTLTGLGTPASPLHVVGGGTVTAVTATSPLTSSGGTTPNISLDLTAVDLLTYDDGTGTISSSVADNHLIGRGVDEGTGPFQAIALGTGLSMSGGPTLNATATSSQWITLGEDIYFDGISHDNLGNVMIGSSSAPTAKLELVGDGITGGSYSGSDIALQFDETGGRIDAFNVEFLTDDNTDHGKLYVSVTNPDGCLVSFYKDLSRTSLVAHFDYNAGSATYNLVEDNSSGLGGTVHCNTSLQSFPTVLLEVQFLIITGDDADSNQLERYFYNNTSDLTIPSFNSNNSTSGKMYGWINPNYDGPYYNLFKESGLSTLVSSTYIDSSGGVYNFTDANSTGLAGHFTSLVADPLDDDNIVIQCNETGDHFGQLGTYIITGATSGNTDNGTLYLTVSEGFLYIYKDFARSQLVGQAGSWDGNSVYLITAQNSSGLGGSVEWYSGDGPHDDSDIVLTGLLDTSSGNKYVLKIRNGYNYMQYGLSIGTTDDPLSGLDVVDGVAVGTYAGVTAAPTGGLIISGQGGFGTSAPSAQYHYVTTDDTDPSIVFSWDSRHTFFGETGATGGGLGFSHTASTNTENMLWLQPSIQWVNASFNAHTFKFYSDGTYLGLYQDASGNAGITLGLYDGSASLGTSGYLLKSTGSATAWSSPLGLGIPKVTTARFTAQTAAKATVVTITPTADATFLVSANVLVTTATTHNFTATVAYTDEGNTGRTVTLQFSTLAGAFITAITNIGGAVPYEGVPIQIRAKASTAITVATTGTFTTVTYNVEGTLIQLA